MRLLRIGDDGEFSLREFLNDDAPPYAILSHTWGADNEEVTFRDIRERRGEKKAGYSKLEFCARRAAKDGLRYFWVDTCCIDKSSSAELSEAINLMFRWYRDAVKCYVYLADILASGDSSQSVSITGSRWFTRGWTLQELIAPSHVDFFSSTGQFLGDKISYGQDISRITGIPIEALRGPDLSRFSVEERFNWAKYRMTARAEDMAYSLLGIFDVFMPLIYGEGAQAALRRLRKEIDEYAAENTRKSISIQRWLHAPDPSTNYQIALNQRLPGTGLWFLESKQYASWKRKYESIMWLHGLAGCGKTVLSTIILQDVFNYCREKPGRVVAYFYFDFKDYQKRSVNLMLRSLILQLSSRLMVAPTKLDTLYSEHKDGKQQPSISVLIDMLQWLISQWSQVYIILDALDECGQQSELTMWLQDISMWQHRNLHMLMTSRQHPDENEGLNNLVGLDDSISIDREEVDKDIQWYIRQRLLHHKQSTLWKKDINLQQEIENTLISGASGMYVIHLNF